MRIVVDPAGTAHRTSNLPLGEGGTANAVTDEGRCSGTNSPEPDAKLQQRAARAIDDRPYSVSRTAVGDVGAATRRPPRPRSAPPL